MAVVELTKFGHACVRLEKDGRRLVVDPGGLTGPEALDGADAVLVTHEHFDHFSEELLRRAAAARPGLRIWTNSSVAKRLDGLGAQVSTTGEGTPSASRASTSRCTEPGTRSSTRMSRACPTSGSWWTSPCSTPATP